jgi:hypothetical protein
MHHDEDITTESLMSADFFDFPTPSPASLPAVTDPLFACSTSSADHHGSVAITEEAVYLGENDEVTRIDAADIRFWSSAEAGHLFALTVESTSAHVTHLFAHFRAATVSAMTRTIGPEGERLHAA